jgi:hypothetical protein
MEINRCKMCKRPFVASVKRYCCDDCKEADEILFDRTEEYLLKFPNSNAIQIAQGLDVPIEMVLGYIDEGRLTLTNGTFEKLPGTGIVPKRMR